MFVKLQPVWLPLSLLDRWHTHLRNVDMDTQKWLKSYKYNCFIFTLIVCYVYLSLSRCVNCHLSCCVNCHLSCCVNCHLSCCVNCHLSCCINCHLSCCVNCHFTMRLIVMGLVCLASFSMALCSRCISLTTALCMIKWYILDQSGLFSPSLASANDAICGRWH